MKVVIDTNVAISANGRDTHASPACQLTCVEFLELLVSEKSHTKIALDDSELIFDEYKNHLSYKGQPGVGDVFFKYLHDHMHLRKKVQLVLISENSDLTRGFDELPVNSVDKSDRKFLAVAVTANAEIVNALDTDWYLQQEFTTGMGITVQQLCPEHGCTNE